MLLASVNEIVSTLVHKFSDSKKDNIRRTKTHWRRSVLPLITVLYVWRRM